MSGRGSCGLYNFGWLCLDADNKVVGSVVIHDIHDGDAWFSFALEAGVTIPHKTLREMVNFGVNTLGLRRLSGMIHPDNKRSQRAAKIMGFKKEGTIRQALPNGDDLDIWGVILKTELRFSPR